ncbi:hypothetical protein PS15p_203437 [Mucor circinelloides]
MMLMEDATWSPTNRILTVIRNMTSVSDDEKMFTTRPDASMNIACGASLGKRIGCGEVKPQYQALNHQAIAKDLIRVGHLLKDASDKNQAKMTLGFVVEIMVLSTSSVVLKNTCT